MPDDVTDEDLDALTRRVRRHRRKQRLAKGAGVAVAFLGLVVGMAADFALTDNGLARLGGRSLWILAGLGALTGALVYRKLDPPGSLHEIE